MNTSKKLRALAALGLLSGAVWAGTYAQFSDDATSTATFSTGAVDLVAGGDVSDAHAFTSLEMAAMKPGDVVYAPLSVANAGTLPFTYGMSTTATNADLKALADALTLGVVTVPDAASCTAAGYAASAGVLDAGGALSGAAVAARALAVGASEVLCFRVELPLAATNAVQAAATTATFTFSATQA